MKITRFEDIETWKEARSLMNMVYELTSKAMVKRDFSLRDQIQRAAVSCMSNIAEGFDSGIGKLTNGFIRYLKQPANRQTGKQEKL